MDLTMLFDAVLRSAEAQERIAVVLESIHAKMGSGGSGLAEAPDATAEAKPKRGRKAKPESEGQALAEQMNAVPVDVPAFVPPAPPAPPPTPAAPPPPPPPLPVPPVQVAPPAPPTVAPPPPPPPPAAAPLPAQPVFETSAVEQQFLMLNQLVIPYFNVPGVRDSLVATAGKYGMGLPFSDPLDRSLPGDTFRSLSNEARADIYHSTARAIESAKSTSL